MRMAIFETEDGSKVAVPPDSVYLEILPARNDIPGPGPGYKGGFPERLLLLSIHWSHKDAIMHLDCTFEEAVQELNDALNAPHMSFTPADNYSQGKKQ